MKIVLLGANNPETARVILAVQRVNPNFEILGFIDNDLEKKGTLFCGYKVFGGFEVLDDLLTQDVYFVNLITGSTRIRYETSLYMAKKGCKFTNLIHPSVDLTMTRLGVGNYIQENVVIQADAQIGDNSSVHMGALVSHESIVGNSVFIAHAVSISGKVEVGDGTFIGTNATIIPRLKIGKWCTIGAGSVVIKDVPDYATVVGNPAKVIKIADPDHIDGKIYS
jgi:sugar O-acyltransferase (sialic acid O-acetyltransferase NeuD family)